MAGGAGRWAVWLVVTLLTPTTTYTYTQGPHGRHVCVTERTAPTTVKSLQTFYKPIYKKHTRMCENSPYRLCTSFRVTYAVAYREVYTQRPQARLVYACCPGWTQTPKAQHGCMRPVCSPPCQHGGRCTTPGRCRCPPAWTGPACQQDVDECSSGRHSCQHTCVNTPGAYRCTCLPGFQPHPSDSHTCQLCLACVPQFSAMSTDIQSLSFRVQTLEMEKTELHQAVVVLQAAQAEQLTVISDLARHLAAQKHTTPTYTHYDDVTSAAPISLTSAAPEDDGTEKTINTESHVMARIQSLTRQIAFLEERLGLWMSWRVNHWNMIGSTPTSTCSLLEQFHFFSYSCQRETLPLLIYLFPVIQKTGFTIQCVYFM